jgi:hypothetical protein
MNKKWILAITMLAALVLSAYAAQSVMGTTTYQSVMGSSHPASVMGTAQTWTSDHTLTFTATSADTYHQFASGGPSSSYPPAYVSSQTTGYTGIYVWKENSAGDHTGKCGFLRWDTSSIPDNATIKSATFNVYFSGWGALGRDCYADFWNWTPNVGLADWSLSSNGTAGIAAVSGPGVKTFTTSSYATGINKTGFTGVRFNISGDAPAMDVQYYFLIELSGHDSVLTVVANY